MDGVNGKRPRSPSSLTPDQRLGYKVLNCYEVYSVHILKGNAKFITMQKQNDSKRAFQTNPNPATYDLLT